MGFSLNVHTQHNSLFLFWLITEWKMKCNSTSTLLVIILFFVGLFFLSLEKSSIIFMIWMGLFNSKQLLCLHEGFHDPTVQSDGRIIWHFYTGILSCYWIKKPPCNYFVFLDIHQIKKVLNVENDIISVRSKLKQIK